MPINQPQTDFELLPAALVFEAVVSCGSFRGAAAELRLSPSTVSARVSALEDALGVRLLHRTTRSVSLTPAGRVLRAEIAPILPRWRTAEARVRAHAEEPQGLLVVTAPDIFMSTLVVPVATTFQARYPDTRVVFRTTATTLSLVDEGVDVAVRAGPLPPSEHGSRLLWRGAHVAVATPEHSRTSALSTPADLRGVPCVALAGRRALSGWRNTSGERVPHEPNITMQADTPHIYVALLLAGAGVGFLPELLAQSSLEAGTLIRVLPDWSSEDVSFHVVTPSARRHGAAVQGFVDALVARFDRTARGASD